MHGPPELASLPAPSAAAENGRGHLGFLLRRGRGGAGATCRVLQLHTPGGRQGGREAGPGAYGSLRYRAESFLLLRANRLRPFWRRKGRREEGRKEEEREGKAVKESGQSEGQREQRPRREGGGRVSAAPQLHSPTERATAATVRRRTEARTLQRTEREVHERTDERTDGRTGATAPDRSLGFCTFGAVDSYF